jgi:hypothetical protein
MGPARHAERGCDRRHRQLITMAEQERCARWHTTRSLAFTDRRAYHHSLEPVCGEGSTIRIQG